MSSGPDAAGTPPAPPAGEAPADAPATAPAAPAPAPTPGPDAPGGTAPEPGVPASDVAERAYHRLRSLGIVLALVGALLLVQYAMGVRNWPQEPPEEYIEMDGGDLTVVYEGASPAGANVTVRRHDGPQLATAQTNATGVATFKGLDQAGVDVLVSDGNATFQRLAWVRQGATITLRVDPADADQAAATTWTGWERPPGGYVGFQVAMLGLIVLGGTMLALRRVYLLGILGAAIAIGTGLQRLLFGDFLMALPLGILGVYAILQARRARPLFR